MSTQYSMQFKDFDAEAFIVRRLADHGRQVFTGVTDPAIRRERIRQAILDGKLEAAIIGKNAAGKAETYSQLFERLYGEPLTPKTRKEQHA